MWLSGALDVAGPVATNFSATALFQYAALKAHVLRICPSVLKQIKLVSKLFYSMVFAIFNGEILNNSTLFRSGKEVRTLVFVL
jgi:hypothetical protein